MARLEEFKALRDVAHTAVQGELCCLFTTNPEASCKRMLEIAAENVVTPTVGVVNVFLKQMDNKRLLHVIELYFFNQLNWQYCLSVKYLRCDIDIRF